MTSSRAAARLKKNSALAAEADFSPSSAESRASHLGHFLPKLPHSRPQFARADVQKFHRKMRRVGQSSFGTDHCLAQIPRAIRVEWILQLVENVHATFGRDIGDFRVV